MNIQHHDNLINPVRNKIGEGKTILLCGNQNGKTKRTREKSKEGMKQIVVCVYGYVCKEGRAVL